MLPMDLIIYAGVAAALFFMLFRMLGTNADEGPVKRNPFVDAPEEVKPKTNTRGETVVKATEVHTPPHMTIDESSSVQQTLFQMAIIDKNFDAGQFVSNAKEAYRIVVESFADGDKSTLEDLLAPHVYEAFEEAINARDKAGETMDNEIRSISNADITSAVLDKKNNATVRVKFTSQQVRVIKDKNGVILDGNENYATTLVDEWSFAKDLKNSDPRWMVSETEDGDPSDGPV